MTGAFAGVFEETGYIIRRVQHCKSVQLPPSVAQNFLRSSNREKKKEHVILDLGLTKMVLWLTFSEYLIAVFVRIQW
jgi:hypothetical protein